MRRRRAPEQCALTQSSRVCSPPWHTLPREYYRQLLFGAALWCLLSFPWSSRPVSAEEAPGFTQSCAGFAQDPLLGRLWPGVDAPGQAPPSALLAAIVPDLSLAGTALATVTPPQGGQAIPTIEAVFGLVPGTYREILETAFTQEARAVVLSPTVLATVAHALTPGMVEVQVTPQTRVQTVPLRITSLTVTVRTTPEDEGVPVGVAHVNTPYDVALAQTTANRPLSPFPYPAVLSYGTGNPASPTGGLRAGDCVAAIMPVRDGSSSATLRHRLVLGKVLAKVPVATNNLTQTTLNVNMFTTDVAAQPGDSGSPVLALQGGKPVLVGLVSSTMYPTATFTYVTRIDPLLALAGALQRAPVAQAESVLVRKADSLSRQEP